MILDITPQPYSIALFAQRQHNGIHSVSRPIIPFFVCLVFQTQLFGDRTIATTDIYRSFMHLLLRWKYMTKIEVFVELTWYHPFAVPAKMTN